MFINELEDTDHVRSDPPLLIYGTCAKTIYSNDLHVQKFKILVKI